MKPSPRSALLVGVLALATLGPSWAAWRQVRRYTSIPLVLARIDACPKVDFSITDVKGFDSPEDRALGIERERRRVVVIGGGLLSVEADTRGSDAPVAPHSAAMYAGRRAYVLDADKGRVYVYDAGVRVFARDVTGPGLHQLAADASGRLLVTEPAREAVCRFTPDLAKDAAFGSDGCVAVHVPLGVGAVPGRVLVTSDAGTILVFDEAGSRLSERRLVGRPDVLGRGPSGRLLMIDRPTGRLWVLDGDGVEVARLGATPGDPLLMGDPRGADVAGRSLWITSAWQTCRYLLPETFR